MTQSYYAGKKILITGGLGFLGSSLANSLIESGAQITVIDSLDPRYGGNEFNIKNIKERIRVVEENVLDSSELESSAADADIIFHFAAQVSYVDSMSVPIEDIRVNSESLLRILDICNRRNREALVVFPSSRLAVGTVDGASYDESVGVNPVTLYGVHKWVGERYLSIYHKQCGVRYLALRITNPYGPRQQMKHSKYSLVGWFIRVAMEGGVIKIFGDGSQQRDYVFVDDIIASIIACVANKSAHNQVINIGSGVSTSFRDMVHTVRDTVGSGEIEHVPWPREYESIEPGASVADISLLKKYTDHSVSTSLAEGVRKTLEYYRIHKKHYFI